MPDPFLSPLHVTADGEEMIVGLHGERLETTLVKVTGTDGMVMGVPALGVGQGQPPHEVGEVPIAVGPEQEVEVIGQHAVG